MDTAEKPIEVKKSELQRQMLVKQSQDDLELFIESVSDILLKVF